MRCCRCWNLTIVVGAAGRVDVIIDLTGKPGSRTTVEDSFYRNSFDLVSFRYESGDPLRYSAADWPMALPPASLPEPDMKTAIVQPIVIADGAMGGLQPAKLNGEWMALRDIAQQGYVWALNDTVAHTLDMPALIEIPRGPFQAGWFLASRFNYLTFNTGSRRCTKLSDAGLNDAIFTQSSSNWLMNCRVYQSVPIIW